MYYTYVSFKFGREARLELDGSTIAVIALHEHFHVVWLLEGGRCARLRCSNAANIDVTIHCWKKLLFVLFWAYDCDLSWLR